MAITYVTAGPWGAGTGSPHSAAEADAIIFELASRINALETTPPVPVSIDTFSIIGDQLKITLTDTSFQTITVPVATWFPLGEWTPLTNYPKFGVVSNTGRLYLIKEAHTSAAVFDPNAVGVGPLYVKILDPPIQPNDYHVFISGVMSDAQTLLFSESVRRWQLPLNLIGSDVRAQIAAADIKVVKLKKNGVDIGTITFTIGNPIGAISFPAAITFEIADTFSIVGPTLADTTLADISFDLLGSRI